MSGFQVEDKDKNEYGMLVGQGGGEFKSSGGGFFGENGLKWIILLGRVLKLGRGIQVQF